jgi:hypothetical protein
VEVTDVVVLVELAPLVRNVVVANAHAHLIVREDNLVTMAVAEIHAVLVPLAKFAATDSVQVLGQELVPDAFADTIEWEEVVVIVPPAKDAGVDLASVTMTVTIETVGLHLKSLGVSVRLKVVEVVPALMNAMMVCVAP